MLVFLFVVIVKGGGCAFSVVVLCLFFICGGVSGWGSKESKDVGNWKCIFENFGLFYLVIIVIK